MLAQDEKRICEIWIKNYERDVEIVLLKKDHIARLMHGLQEYIEKNDRVKLENAINTMKEDFNSESVAVNQIQLALFLFRDAVNNVLRSHNIKPHWMFALDSLVSSAIQVSIHILSPGKPHSTIFSLLFLLIDYFF